MLMFIGVGFMVAWFSGSRWYIPAIAGAVLGLTATGFAGVFAPPLPKPTALQATALIASILVESILVFFAIRRFGDQQDKLVLAVLGAVGVHFFVMIPSLGPSIALLATLTTLNAAAGWKWSSRIHWQAVGCVDSTLKIGFGAWMFLATTSW